MSGMKPVGAHKEKRLSYATIRNLKEAGSYGDGNGLYLKVDKSGAKRWFQRIVIQGKRRDIGLGSAALVSLAEAREQALQHRKVARSGEDPIAAKRRSTGILTFEETAKRVHKLSEPTWRNAKHGQQWINTLTAYAFPTIGSKRIDTVTNADVLAVLMPIWTVSEETARRVKQRIGTVMKHAMAEGWRTDNPAEAITKALPRHDRSKVVHRLALPCRAVSHAIATVKASNATQATKLAFEFMVLTATRPSESLKARWSEFNIDAGLWTIPAARMKAKKEHCVPLSKRCLAIMGEARILRQAESDLVFPGTKKDRPLSENTLSKLMKQLNIAAVPHGFRSSFRDWAGDETTHAREVIEFCLAHVTKDKSEAAYARSSLLAKRSKVMSDWSAYLEGTS
jgi:integrase